MCVCVCVYIYIYERADLLLNNIFFKGYPQVREGYTLGRETELPWEFTGRLSTEAQHEARMSLTWSKMSWNGLSCAEDGSRWARCMARCGKLRNTS